MELREQTEMGWSGRIVEQVQIQEKTGEEDVDTDIC